jgi:hypothetical protein
MKIFLMQINSYITDRPYSLVTEPSIAPSSSKDINCRRNISRICENIPEIIRHFPKSGPRKSGGRKKGKRRFLTDTTED